MAQELIQRKHPEITLEEGVKPNLDFPESLETKLVKIDKFLQELLNTFPENNKESRKYFTEIYKILNNFLQKLPDDNKYSDEYKDILTNLLGELYDCFKENNEFIQQLKDNIKESNLKDDQTDINAEKLTYLKDIKDLTSSYTDNNFNRIKQNLSQQILIDIRKQKLDPLEFLQKYFPIILEDNKPIDPILFHQQVKEKLAFQEQVLFVEKLLDSKTGNLNTISIMLHGLKKIAPNNAKLKKLYSSYQKKKQQRLATSSRRPLPPIKELPETKRAPTPPRIPKLPPIQPKKDNTS